MEKRRSDSRVSKPQGGRKFRGLTCANCRARKVKCEGGQPSCKTCEIYHDECRYDKTPPISQVIAMAKRLQEAEKTIEDLRTGSPGRTPSYISFQDTAEEVTLDLPRANRAATTDTALGDGNPSTSQPTGAFGIPNTPTNTSRNQTGDDQIRSDNGLISNAAPKEPHPTELSVDEDGKICYYGPTSAVHDPPAQGLQTPESQDSVRRMSSSSRAEVRSSLAAFWRESATWEEFALGNAALETGIPRQVMARLLHLHWTWVSPMFGWVYRPAFVRDMATGGRYYSEFLLTVICAHAAKYQDSNCADLLLTRARRLLGAAIQQPSSIPTVQALLQLSARDLAHGSISQAWVYSGIAFRMASDLGLQHTGPTIKGLSAVDLEVRRRLFWSCYFWDKATSLYAGRLPAVTEVLQPETLDLLDDSAEMETWTPYYGDSLNLTKMTQHQYPQMTSHSVSCFSNSCKLSIIINDIIVQLYSKRNRTITVDSLRDVKSRLDNWRAKSPPHLRYDPDNLPTICPPPHLISQNMLYFTTVILAHRPFWSAPGHYATCINASQSIEKLVLLLERTFGLDNITYLMGYCVYTGASAILEDAKNRKGTANSTLKTFLRALNTAMRRCPLLERSLNIIVKSLNKPPVTREQADNGQAMAFHSTANNHLPPEVDMTANTNNGFIPAFPYLGSPADMEFDVNQFFASGDVGSMGMLDCYPEMQMDMGELIVPSLS